jgi:hypothetical protein
MTIFVFVDRWRLDFSSAYAGLFHQSRAACIESKRTMTIRPGR